MKKKICFVGFSGEELEPLQPVLSRVAAVWDCLFFPDGASALVALGAGAVDAVVASAGKNSLDAAEFMHQAATRQPRALRLILGNVVEQELIISCIGATHQFIAKPCKPQDLISTIQRALALDACMSSDQIRALAPKLRRLPSLPSTYFEVLKQVESSSSTVQSVGEVIMRDPALTARLLQMVNSAAFALAQKVTDPMDAVSLLGMETVRSVVLCLQVFSQNDTAKQSGISLDQLWDHSLSVAEMAREITRFQTRDELLANEAFTAGLLHDVGRIVIAANLPGEYADTVKFAREQGRPLQLQEAAQFGVDHAQVGAYLMGLWGMPAALVESTALHHTPSRTPAHEFSLLTAVHVADVFAHEKEEAKSGLVQPRLDPNYLSALGLDDKVEVWRKMLSGETVPLEEDVKTNKAEKPTTRRAPADIVRPLPVEAAKSGRSLSNILAPAGLFLVIVAALFIWQRAYQADVVVLARARQLAAPAAPKVPATPKPAPATAPSLTTNVEIPNPNPAPAVLRGFDSIKLEGILFAGNSSSVILNGKILSVGQRINGVVVEAIDSTSVTLAYQGHEKILRAK